jgi:hypothetical protein
MSAILPKITPWIAKTIFEVMVFDPEQTPKLDRKTRIVQIVSLPERVPMTLNNVSNRSYIRFTVSDSKNKISVYVSHDDDNNNVFNDELERLRHGSLVRLKHLQVSTHNLLGVTTNTNLNKPTCLVVHSIQMKSESIVHLDETTSDGVALESMGCENAGIIGNPLDVHEDIDVKRALIAMKYDHRTLARQVIDCFNYIVSGPSFETKGEKLLPGNDVIIGAFDSTDSMDEWSSIMNIYKQVDVRETKEISKDYDSSADGDDQESCHSSEIPSGQKERLDGHRSMLTPNEPKKMASISEMLGNSDSEESEDDDNDNYVGDKIETQMEHVMYESQPDSNQDVLDRLETQGHDDMDGTVGKDNENMSKSSEQESNENMSQSSEQESNLIETQGPTTAFECNNNDQDSHQSIDEKDDDSEQSSPEDEYNLETQAPEKLQESPEDDKVDSDEESEGPAILQTQPMNTIGHDLDSDVDDYHSAHSDFIDDNEQEQGHAQDDGNLKENKRKKKKIMSVSTWLKSQSQSDPHNPVNEPWSQPSMDSQLSNGTKKTKVLSVSSWLKKDFPISGSSAKPSLLLQRNDSSKMPFDYENRPNYTPPSSFPPQNHEEQEDVDNHMYTSQSSEHDTVTRRKRKKKVFSVSAWKSNDIDF